VGLGLKLWTTLLTAFWTSPGTTLAMPFEIRSAAKLATEVQGAFLVAWEENPAVVLEAVEAFAFSTEYELLSAV
jgi:hypothetical protein